MTKAQFEFLSLIDRKAIAVEDFGDPERFLFPILSQEDVDRAPMRIRPLTETEKLRDRIISIAKRKGFSLPEEWSAITVAASFSDKTSDGIETIRVSDFALDSETKADTKDGEYVLRTGKIFEAGDYPDKDFDISPEELLEAIADFAPVDLDLEHMPTVLDGKLGKLEAVALGSDGWSLVGTVRLPKWLDSQLGDGERKVSATWDRTKKRLTKLAIVRNPRVKDAALMAAFAADELTKAAGIEKGTANVEALTNGLTKFFELSAAFAFKTWEGMSVLQQMHDQAARAGAVCAEPKKDNADYTKDAQALEKLEEAGFVSANEAKIIQQVHDFCVRGGARCSSVGDNKGCSVPYSTENTNSKTEEIETMNFKAIKEFFKGLPDDFDPAQVKNTDNTDATAPKTEDKVEDKVTNAASDKKEDVAAITAKVDVKEEVKNSAPEPSAREKELEAELAKLREKEVAREAEGFADAEIKAERAFPAERETLIALFTQAYKDDSTAGTKVTFKDGDKDVEVSRVDALKSLYSVRKPHNLTKEELEGLGAGVLVTNSGDDTDYLAEAERAAKEYAARRNRGAKK
jgi:hypothetical protein